MDVGAGIGRVTKALLSDYFKKTDLLEQSTNLADKAKENLSNLSKLKKGNELGDIHKKSCRDFLFPRKYDCIWTNWVFGYLLDCDMLKFC